ncbi:MAG: hypothetical protein IPF41_01670 [Flavobacteriales bacterium]|nr:hypothetical protein [Flavobacteriales bacterium]
MRPVDPLLHEGSTCNVVSVGSTVGLPMGSPSQSCGHVVAADGATAQAVTSQNVVLTGSAAE